MKRLNKLSVDTKCEIGLISIKKIPGNTIQLQCLAKYYTLLSGNKNGPGKNQGRTKTN
jgi:hypothetical protein